MKWKRHEPKSYEEEEEEEEEEKEEEEEEEEECLAWCSNSYRNNYNFTFWATTIMPAMAGCTEWRSQYRKSFVTTIG